MEHFLYRRRYTPLCLVLQNLANLRHQIRFQYGDLRHTRLAPAGIVLDLAGEALAFDQILDLHHTFGTLITALDDGDGGTEAVGIFQLVAEFLPVALIHFGADALGAQRLRECLVTAHALHITVHDGDENGGKRLHLTELAEVLQCRHQARDADGEAGGRNRLAHEARNEAIITPAATDRAEYDLFALFIGDIEGQLGLIDRAGIIFETANNRGVDLDTCRIVAGTGDQSADDVQLINAFLAFRGARYQFGEIIGTCRIILDADEKQHLFNLLLAKTSALGEITGLILAAGAEQQLHAFRAELVELVDGAQHVEATAGILLAAETDGFHDAIEHLAIVDANDIVATRNTERFQRIGHHHAHFGIRLHAGSAHRIGIELHELPETAGAGLFIAEHITGAIGAVWQLDFIEVFRHMTGERRGEIVAQAHPLVVVILKRKHAFVRTVAVRQELAERIGIFELRRFDRIETVKLVYLADLVDHLVGGMDIGSRAVHEATRQAGFQFLRLFCFFAHDADPIFS